MEMGVDLSNQGEGPRYSRSERRSRVPVTVNTKICCDNSDKLRNNNRVLVTLPNFAEKSGQIRFDSVRPIAGQFEEGEEEVEGELRRHFSKSYRNNQSESKNDKNSDGETPKRGEDSSMKHKVLVTLDVPVVKMIQKSAKEVEKILDSVGQLVVVNLLKPGKYSSYKIHIPPEVILPNVVISTSTIVEMEKGNSESIIGLSCLHGAHVGGESLFDLIYPKKGRKLDIKSNDYERCLLWFKDKRDLLFKIEMIEAGVRNWLSVWQDYIHQEKMIFQNPEQEKTEKSETTGTK